MLGNTLTLGRADTQGLLDRVFPLDDVLQPKPSSAASTSRTSSDSYSLRTLLKESKDHPLMVFRVSRPLLNETPVLTLS